MATPHSIAFTPLLPRARRSSTIAAELRRLISCGQLKPGDQLPTEAMLCQQFGVSRTTLREAIQMLRTSGLLDVTPGRGSFIRTPDVRQLLSDLALVGQACVSNPADIIHLRLLIQRDIIGRLAKTQPGQRKELYQHTLNRMASPEENAASESAWHLTMAHLAGNQLQTLMLQTLLALETSSRQQRYRNPDEVLRTIHIQMRTNTALIEGDWPLAERVLSQYLNPQHNTQFAA
jgi:GntR family transcriptional repressor for pyruvate dehydrogenase complex